MDPARLVIVPDLLAVAMCAVGAAIDLRTRRIPNRLTVTGMIAGVVVNTAIATAFGGIAHGLAAGLLLSLAGAASCFVLFGALGAIGAMGMGDVKLMIAVGALLGWPMALWSMIYVLLAGGAVSLVYAVAGGKLGAVLGNLFRLAGRRDRDGAPLHRIPYGLAIFLGCLYAALASHYPALRFP